MFENVITFALFALVVLFCLGVFVAGAVMLGSAEFIILGSITICIAVAAGAVAGSDHY